MKYHIVSPLIALSILVLPVINGPLGTEAGIAEAGPLGKRLETKHKLSSHAETGGNEAHEKCIEMLHKGDHEGAQNCISQLQDGDSNAEQAPAAQVESTQSTDVKSPATVQADASGAQGDLQSARDKCAEMLRNGNRSGARECIQKLKQ